jgi:hypothetical protein
MSRWGAAPSDVARVMAGDALIAKPTYSGTMAVTVDARPEHIWPWLVQMGYRRGGLYSYDWLDRLFGYLDRPSASRILPDFQHLAVGDHIPLGRGPSWPVAAVEPNRALVLDMRNLGGLDWVWQFGLYAIDDHRTRLVSRSRVRTQAAWARLVTYAIGLTPKSQSPQNGRAVFSRSTETTGTHIAASNRMLSLKSFHVFFVLVAMVLTCGLGVWGLRNGYVAMGLISLAVSLALLVYEGYFAGKSDRLHLE